MFLATETSFSEAMGTILPLMVMASIPGGWSIFHAPSIALQCIISSENPSTLNDVCWTLGPDYLLGRLGHFMGDYCFLVEAGSIAVCAVADCFCHRVGFP